MNETAQLIVNKLDEIIRVVGREVETFYPCVVRQIIYQGVGYLIVFVIASLYIAWNAKNFHRWVDDEEVFKMLVFGFVGLILVIVTIVGLIEGFYYLLNPHYYAVKDILSIGKSLIQNP